MAATQKTTKQSEIKGNLNTLIYIQQMEDSIPNSFSWKSGGLYPLPLNL